METFTFYSNPDLNTSDFLSHRNQINIHRMSIFNKAIIFLELVFLFLAFYSYKLEPYSPFHYVNYMIMYSFMIGLNLVSYLLFRRYSPQKNNMKYEKRYYHLTLIFLFIFVLWGAIISIMDQHLYGSLSAFFVNIIIVIAIFNINSKHITLIEILSISVLYIGIIFFQKDSDILRGNFVNSSVFLVFTLIAFNIHYHQFCKSYLESKTPKNQIRENIMIQMNLENQINQLSEKANIDALTHLPNRRGLHDYLQKIKKAHLIESVPICFIMMDIDYFKTYNDNYGHIAGDKVLVKVSNVLEEMQVTNQEFVCRFGGEEFLYISVGQNLREANQLSNQIKEKIKALHIPHVHSDVNPYLTLSFGIHTCSVGDLEDFESHIDAADRALYDAKNSGRNSIFSR